MRKVFAVLLAASLVVLATGDPPWVSWKLG
jgi:hypothetical protein